MTYFDFKCLLAHFALLIVLNTFMDKNKKYKKHVLDSASLICPAFMTIFLNSYSTMHVFISNRSRGCALWPSSPSPKIGKIRARKNLIKRSKSANVYYFLTIKVTKERELVKLKCSS